VKISSILDLQVRAHICVYEYTSVRGVFIGLELEDKKDFKESPLLQDYIQTPPKTRLHIIGTPPSPHKCPLPNIYWVGCEG